MKKIVFRILAFALDIGVCSLIIFGLSLLDFINQNNVKINEYYSYVTQNREEYNDLLESMSKYFEDGMLSDEENIEISIKYPDYSEAFQDLKLNEDIKNREIESIKDKVDELNVTISNNLVIEINKLNWVQTVISFVVYVLYFGVLQYFMKGQTPFKRIFRLKVVKKNGGKVSLISYIIRALLVSEIIISIVDLSLLFTLSNLKYITCNYWLMQFKYIYQMGFLVCMIVRDDMRSVHDLILGTEVIRYDKAGKKINDILFLNEGEDDNEIDNKND